MNQGLGFPIVSGCADALRDELERDRDQNVHQPKNRIRHMARKMNNRGVE